MWGPRPGSQFSAYADVAFVAGCLSRTAKQKNKADGAIDDPLMAPIVTGKDPSLVAADHST